MRHAFGVSLGVHLGDLFKPPDLWTGYSLKACVIAVKHLGRDIKMFILGGNIANIATTVYRRLCI